MFKHITIDVPDPCANCGHLIGYLYQFTREMLEQLFLLKYVTVSLSTSCSCANERNRFEKQFGRLTQWDCPVTGQGAKNTKGPRWNCCTLTLPPALPHVSLGPLDSSRFFSTKWYFLYPVHEMVGNPSGACIFFVNCDASIVSMMEMKKWYKNNMLSCQHQLRLAFWIQVGPVVRAEKTPPPCGEEPPP